MQPSVPQTAQQNQSSSSSTSTPSPPQAKGWPVVGSPWLFGKDMHRTLAGQHDTLGDVYFFRLVGRRIWMLREPALVEQVLMTDREVWQKTDSPAYDALRTLLGDGLVTAEGPAWLKHRRLAQPAFHRERIASFTDTIARCATDVDDAFAAAAAAGTPRDLSADMLAFTQRVIAKTMLSIDVDAGEGESLGAALDVALHAVERRANSPLTAPLWLPTKNNRDLKSSRAVLDALVYAVIDERLAARAAGRGQPAPGTGKGDLLDMLLDAVDEDSGERLTREELRDDVMTIFLAGHETTSNLLSWTFVALAQSPAIADALAAEWAGRDPREAARPSQTPTLLDRVIDESLRWRPPVWTVDRVAQRDATLGPYTVQKGDIVLVSPWAMHHHARYWPEPERFDPDRFLPSSSSTRPRFAYFPFLAGNRKCIGDTFALTEAKIALATWIPRHRFAVDGVPKEELAVTMRPAGGVPARITRR